LSFLVRVSSASSASNSLCRFTKRLSLVRSEGLVHIVTAPHELADLWLLRQIHIRRVRDSPGARPTSHVFVVDVQDRNRKIAGLAAHDHDVSDVGLETRPEPR